MSLVSNKTSSASVYKIRVETSHRFGFSRPFWLILSLQQDDGARTKI